MGYKIFILFLSFCCSTAFGQFTINQTVNLPFPVAVSDYCVTNGKNGVLRLKLGTNPGENTYVFFQNTDSVSFSPDTVVFTTTNYNTFQSVVFTSEKAGINTFPNSGTTGLRRTGIDTIVVPLKLMNSKYNNAYSGKIKVPIVSPNYNINIVTYNPETEKVWDTMAVREDINANFFHTSIPSLNALRQTLLNFLYPTTGVLPTGGVDSIYTNVALNGQYRNGCNPVGFVNFQKMDVLVTQNNGFKHYLYHIHPQVKRNIFVFVHSGHTTSRNVDCWNYPSSGANSNNYALICSLLVQNGYDVIFSQMPCQGLNTGPGGLNSASAHNLLSGLETSTFHPLSSFITPWVQAKNYIKSAYNPAKIVSAGLSGGGWTATMWPALDQDINCSFDVAGSSPTYVKDIVNSPDFTGDYEQGGQLGTDVYDLYRNTISYEDLYVMASQNRHHYQLINLTDDCCFWGRYWQTWEKVVREKAKERNGLYEVFEYSAPYHQFSRSSVDFILSKLK
jgi:hypothetical protein